MCGTEAIIMPDYSGTTISNAVDIGELSQQGQRISTPNDYIGSDNSSTYDEADFWSFKQNFSAGATIKLVASGEGKSAIEDIKVYKVFTNGTNELVSNRWDSGYEIGFEATLSERGIANYVIKVQSSNQRKNYDRSYALTLEFVEAGDTKLSAVDHGNIWNNSNQIGYSDVLGPNDTDLYKVPMVPGRNYEISFMPQGDASVDISVWEPDSQTPTHLSLVNGQHTHTVNFTAKKAGQHYIAFHTINSRYNDTYHYQYTLNDMRTHSETSATMFVGDPYDDNCGAGVGGSDINPSTDQNLCYMDLNWNNYQADESGAVLLYKETLGQWNVDKYLKAPNPDKNDRYGTAVSQGSNGEWLAIGAPGESNCGKNIAGIEANGKDDCTKPSLTDNTSDQSGAVYLYNKRQGNWTHTDYIKSPNSNSNDHFGDTLYLASAETPTLFIGAPGERNCGAGVGGNNTNPNWVHPDYQNTNACNPSMDDNSMISAGAVYIYTYDNNHWNNITYIKSPNPDMADFFGTGLRSTKYGNTLVVTAPQEDNCGSGVNGTSKKNTHEDCSNPGMTNNETIDAGAIYVYGKHDSQWKFETYIKSPNPDPFDKFGTSFNMNSTGDMLIVGAPNEDSCNPNALGCDNHLSDNNLINSGAAYIYRKINNQWVYEATLKAPNADENDNFGNNVFIASDNRVMVSALGEDYCDEGAWATNVPELKNSQSSYCTKTLGYSNNTGEDTGAVYIFEKQSNGWVATDYIKAPNAGTYDRFGGSGYFLTEDRLIISAPGEDSCGIGPNGSGHNHLIYCPDTGPLDNSATNSGALYFFSKKNGNWDFESYLKAPNTNHGEFFGGGSIGDDNNGSDEQSEEDELCEINFDARKKGHILFDVIVCAASTSN